MDFKQHILDCVGMGVHVGMMTVWVCVHSPKLIWPSA